MQNDCEIFVDPEEDEVFFGCMSEREKIASSKLVKCAEPSSKVCESQRVSNNVINIEEESIEDYLKNEQSAQGVIPNNQGEWSSQEDSEIIDKSDDSITILSDNTSVELEHNYSTPVKHKIDKSILTTPKSIVKADRDGGFLKVLSEIALVKAEAEGNKESEKKKEDEDKENKVKPVPEIRVTEATPEKGSAVSPPRSVRTEMRKFRIIYNSPQNDENIDQKSNSYENEQNIKNKYLDQESDMVLNSEKRKSIDLIDLNESILLLEKEEEENSTEVAEKKQSSEKLISKEGKEKVDIDKIPNGDVINNIQPPKGLRFSKDARKIVEFLKMSTADDTLNFTIPEIDTENEENSFLNPEQLSMDDVVLPSKNVAVRSPKVAVRSSEEKMEKAKTVEKERRKLTPVVSRSKLQPLKYYSERRVNKYAGEVSKCVKKLPMEEKRAVEKVNGVSGDGGGDCKTAPTSRIPVFDSKNRVREEVPNERVGRPLTAKATHLKTPSAKTYKNPKFNHIESPINAYIHNKPTSLVQNVKPEVKKDLQGLSRVWKAQATVSATKLQEKMPSNAMRLPFVEYKSATPYKIEKQSESRLPRLAPNVFKLIGSHSPKVLKHQGRFYVKTSRKQSSPENSTVVAGANEVSVVVSQEALKSHTFK